MIHLKRFGAGLALFALATGVCFGFNALINWSPMTVAVVFGTAVVYAFGAILVEVRKP